LEDNDYPIPLFHDRDFPGQNPQLAKSKVAKRNLVSAIGYFPSILFGHYDMVLEEGDNHRLQGFIWNLSRYIDIISAIRDKAPANTLFSTRKARSLSKRFEAIEAEALDQMVRERIQEMSQTNVEIALAGGATIFDRYPTEVDEKRITVDSPSVHSRPVGLYFKIRLTPRYLPIERKDCQGGQLYDLVEERCTETADSSHLPTEHFIFPLGVKHEPTPGASGSMSDPCPCADIRVEKESLSFHRSEGDFLSAMDFPSGLAFHCAQDSGEHPNYEQVPVGVEGHRYELLSLVAGVNQFCCKKVQEFLIQREQRGEVG
jgi:hypothetical protein